MDDDWKSKVKSDRELSDNILPITLDTLVCKGVGDAGVDLADHAGHAVHTGWQYPFHGVFHIDLEIFL